MAKNLEEKSEKNGGSRADLRNQNNHTKSPASLAEEKILAFWRERKIFEKTLAKPAPKGDFVFYDGPPFATGLPHYGHILASAIKDAVPRFWTMKGRRVERRWGWDCHGLPIENIVENDLKISGKKEIEALGIEKFNERARSKVLEFVSHWREAVERIGRWVDFDGSYKTMDNSFIESVWWALKKIWDKKLIYEGVRVLPYCPRCETPIANSEIAMDNSYKDISDISVYVKLELKDEPETFLLAWTTTPWTLPGNTAAAVNKDLVYVKARNGASGENLIFARKKFEAISALAKDMKLEIVGEMKGSSLIGKSYKPIFDYFTAKNIANKENAWKVYSAPYVTTETGTGIVHLAPAYGEQDMELAKLHNIPFVWHVGPDGKFSDELKVATGSGLVLAGLKVKPKPTDEDKNAHQSSDILIIKDLAARGLLFAKEKIVHSYPHCFRCETPLYYFAIPAWFIEISAVKKKMIKLNEKIHWVPEHLKHGRFGKSMEAAPDWNISRNRYWASPLPIWKCGKCDKTEFVGSLSELKERASAKNKYFIMRHGQAENNFLGILSARPENKHHLTELGRSSVEKAAKSLRREKIDLIYTSPFLRTKETAEIAAKVLGLASDKIITDPRLGEMNFGALDGKSTKAYGDFYGNSYERAFKETMPQGENLSLAKKRAGNFLYEIEGKNSGKNILIISHETPLWMLKSVAAGANVAESITLRENRDDVMAPAEIEQLPFAPIPHNKNFELDFHRPYIDEITFSCSCGGEMKRIKEVIDCWFESGSMPFAQSHYPFENKKKFEKSFPAQFVAEYIAQTRTWFYYTHALSAILFGDIPFENVVTTGTVVAEDGEKMSKSKGNFPDPAKIFDRCGVDALRFYLLSSPVMKSEDLRFSEKGVDEVYKKIISRLRNVLSFYELYKEEAATEGEKFPKSENVLDKWILSRFGELISQAEKAMDAYEIDKALVPVDAFIEDLSLWYLRRSRERLKSEDEGERRDALSTFHFVLRELSKIIAPFTPFIAEEIYQKVTGGKARESVHLEDWPKTWKPDQKVLKNMETARKIVSLALEARAKAGIKVRQPLSELRVKSPELKGKNEFVTLIADEVNVKSVSFDAKIAEEVSLDTKITDELRKQGDLRELLRFIQDLRKKRGLNPGSPAILFARANEPAEKFVKEFEKEILNGAFIEKISFAGMAETGSAASGVADDTSAGETLGIGEMKFTLWL